MVVEKKMDSMELKIELETRDLEAETKSGKRRILTMLSKKAGSNVAFHAMFSL